MLYYSNSFSLIVFLMSHLLLCPNHPALFPTYLTNLLLSDIFLYFFQLLLFLTFFLPPSFLSQMRSICWSVSGCRVSATMIKSRYGILHLSLLLFMNLSHSQLLLSFLECNLSADQLVSKVLSGIVVQPNWCHKYDLLLNLTK